ncbi:hypothetical protein AAY473_003914 [Plecturocebus cupreus]
MLADTGATDTDLSPSEESSAPHLQLQPLSSRLGVGTLDRRRPLAGVLAALTRPGTWLGPGVPDRSPRTTPGSLSPRQPTHVRAAAPLPGGPRDAGGRRGARGGRRRVEPPARPLPRAGGRATRRAPRGGRGVGGRWEAPDARAAPLWLRPPLGPDPLGPRRLRRAHLPVPDAEATIAATSVAAAATTRSLPALSASFRLRLRLRLPGSALQLRGLRGTAPGLGARRPARAQPGVKLRPSLGSGENLLKPGVARGGDRDGGGRGRKLILGSPSRPCSGWPTLGRWRVPLGKGRVGRRATEQKEPASGVGVVGPADFCEDEVWFFGRFVERMSGSSAESWKCRIDEPLTAPPHSSLRSFPDLKQLWLGQVVDKKD